MQHYTTAPPAAAPGLDLFAAAWLERWLAHGGTFTVTPDGKGQMFTRVNCSDIPGYEPPPEDWTDEQRDRQWLIDHLTHNGRTRELMDLLELVPGGPAAVKAHVRTFPSFSCPGGTVGVM